MRNIRVIAGGIGLLVAISGLSVTGQADSALAAPARHRPVHTGQFKTWPAAQKAAAFKLLKPGNTYGLARSGHIIVVGCYGIHRKKGVRQIYAGYGGKKHFFEYFQTSYSRPCVKVPGKFIAIVHVAGGATATLAKVCGAAGEPSCSSSPVPLMLTWSKGGNSYQVFTFGQGRARTVGFARALIRVK